MAKQYISETYGNKFYYKDPAKTILHRVDGPAVEHTDGCKAWYQNGVRHRLDGPAVEYGNGGGVYFVDGWYLFNFNKDDKIISKME